MSKRLGHVYANSEPILMQTFEASGRHSQFYDEEAAKVSQRIDDELRVCLSVSVLRLFWSLASPERWCPTQGYPEKTGQRSVHSTNTLYLQPTDQHPVMLLGQAESGKSTLQKQFQLYYAHHAIDHERPLWRPVVYFNVIKAVRMILDELDHELNNLTNDDSVEGQAVAHALAPLGDLSGEFSRLRTKLVPLVAMEDSLASELSGGVAVTGGRSGVYVRAGWQALVTPLSPNRSRALPGTGGPSPAVAQVTNLASRTLISVQNEVDELWKHSAVRILLNNRRIRLDESAPLYDDLLGFWCCSFTVLAAF